VAVIEEKNANLITPLKEKKRRKGHVILPWTHHFVEYTVGTSVACAVGPSVTTSSTDFSFQNLVFGNLFEFSAAEIT
jgi:ribosomal protein L21E